MVLYFYFVRNILHRIITIVISGFFFILFVLPHDVLAEHLKGEKIICFKSKFTKKDTVFLKTTAEQNSVGKQKILNTYGALMFYHYSKKQEDSTLFYLRKINDILNSDHSSIDPYILIKGYLHNAYILRKHYGHTSDVINLFDKGYTLAKEIGDRRSIMYIALEKSTIILENNPSVEELDNILNDLILLKQEYQNENHYKSRITRIIASIYIKKKDFSNANIWINKAKQTNNHFNKILSQRLYSYYLFKTDSIKKALKIIKTSVRSLQDSINDKDELAKSYYYKFLYEKESNDSQKAIQSIEKAIETALSRVSEVRYLDSLISYIEQTKSSTDQLEIAIKRKQALVYKINGNDLDLNNDFFITKINEKDLKIKNSQLIDTSIKKTKLIYILVILLLATLLFVLYYKNIRQVKKKNETIFTLEQREAKLLAAQVQQREDDLQLVTIQMANRVGKLKQLQETVSKIKGTQPEIKSLKKNIKELIRSGEDISGVSDRLKSQYPGIYANLKRLHPELSETEIKYCLLTKLNLSMKETGNILNVTPNTVKNARNRIKRKINISKEISLRVYLNTLDHDDVIT